jgi:predicted outer membrane protein
VVFAVIAALTVAVFQYWNTESPATPATAQTGLTQTEWGPLGPADRDLLIKVRQAGLWEGPTGQQAQQQGSSARVREVGRLISAEHADLDAQVRDVSAKLGVLLPNQPTEQQQGWMAEIAGQSGADFDRTFVQRLRAAHGKVLPIIAQVRSGTRNDLVRQFATTAAQFVTRHHEYLESTGLVDFSALPEPPAPDPSPPAAVVPPAAAAPATAIAAAGTPATGTPATGTPATGHEQHVNPVAQASSVGGVRVVVAALVYIAALLAIVGLLWLLGTAGLRARQSRRQPRRAVPEPPGLPSRARHAAQRW